MMRDPRRQGRRRLLALPGTVRRLQRDIDDEIRFHLESRVGELIAQDRARTEDVTRMILGGGARLVALGAATLRGARVDPIVALRAD